mmetsp:Transcript_30526/g.65752  ORF Transcript_30526/g.65752 Transcript_30526/m.65752 type:complete len:294 (-) Transcript_30526:71-952(-)
MTVTVVVHNMAGEVEMGPRPLPVPLLAEDVICCIPDFHRMDILLLGEDLIGRRGEIPFEGEMPETVTFTMVKVRPGMLDGLDDALVSELVDRGAVQKSPAGFSDDIHCLNLAKKETQSFSGGGFGGKEDFRQCLLLSDGRILTKRYDGDDYMEKSGDYKGSFIWEMAEGTYEVEGGGHLRVTWTAWAELRVRSTEPFGPGDFTDSWQAKDLNADALRLPTIVQQNDGMIDVKAIVTSWMKEDPNSGYHATRKVRTEDGPVMTRMTEEVLEGLGFSKDHFPFYSTGSGVRTLLS